MIRLKKVVPTICESESLLKPEPVPTEDIIIPLEEQIRVKLRLDTNLVSPQNFYKFYEPKVERRVIKLKR